jgi:hypothetical protein
MSEVCKIEDVPFGSTIVDEGKSGIVLGHHPDGNNVVVSWREDGIEKVLRTTTVEVVEGP